MAESKIVPNTFQTPNILVDDLMRLMTGDEVKCYLVIVRKTFGWLKRTDRIAKSQIIAKTGLSESAVDDCMKTLVQFDIVKRLAENDPTKNFGVEWEIQLDDGAIHFSEMVDRDSKRQESNQKRASRLKKVGITQTPPYLPDTGGGYHTDTPQKPLSKATKELRDIQDPVAEKLSLSKFPFNPNSGTIIQAWKDDFPDPIIIRAIDEALAKGAHSLTYVDRIICTWKANGVPPTREERIAAAKKLPAVKAQTKHADFMAGLQRAIDNHPELC